jgi:hypothetical protein
MLHITINAKLIQVPESWQDVKWKHYLRLQPVLSDATLSKWQRIIGLLNVFNDDALHFEEDLAPMSLEAGVELFRQVSAALAFLSEQPEPQPVKQFEMGGKIYFVQPLGESFGAFATYDKIEEDHRERPLYGITWKLACLCRLKGESFQDVEKILVERKAVMEEVDTQTVISLRDFFLQKDKQFKAFTQSSLTLQYARENLRQNLKKTLASRSAGGRPLTTWQRMFAKWILSSL